jgi:hypothetical protein
MGLKGYRLWAMGQLDSNVQSPTSSAFFCAAAALSARCAFCQGVAVHVAFERQTLKPDFHFIGYRLWG